MSKILIIAEKQKVAAKVAAWMDEEPVQNKGSYYETPSSYIAYADGQLFEPYDIEDYTKDAAPQGWKMDNLPFCPPGNNFFYRLASEKDPSGKKVPKAKAKTLFNTINHLVNLPDVTTIYHYGDSDREGEVIIRQILNNSNKSGKPVYRIWTGETTKRAFTTAYKNAILDSNYDNLAAEGFVRAKEDWLYGINLTRYLSLKCHAPMGRPLRVGRVLLGMLYELYSREIAIQSFTPEQYYALISSEETNGEQITLQCKDKYNIDDYVAATERCAQINQHDAIVSSLTSEEKVMSAGKLYSLTTLQNALSKLFEMSMSESMPVIQSVYEKGYITYPRTNTEYLGETEKENVKYLIQIFNDSGYKLEFKDSKKIFDNSKIEGHSALIPTYKIPKAEDLTEKEWVVYNTVKNRFLAVFCAEKTTYLKSTMKITCGDEEFTLTGKTILSQGFLQYENIEKKDTLLPKLQQGDKVNILFSPVQKETTPPPHYTEVSFNLFLEHPFSKQDSSEDDLYNDLKKGLTIGTVATRTSIINNMIQCGYISLDKHTYKVLPLGFYLVQALEQLGINLTKEKTAECNVILKKVNNGETSSDEALEIVKKDLSYMFRMRDKDIENLTDARIITETGQPVDNALGSCPICDGNIYETKKGFICENNRKDDPSHDCFFYLWKSDKYIEALTSKDLSASQVANALKKGCFLADIKSKNKKSTYQGIVKMKIDPEKQRCGWMLEKSAGKCPICGGSVNITPFGWICENNSENGNCFFILFKEDRFLQKINGKPLSLSNVMSLLKNGSFRVQAEKKDKSGKYSLKLSLIIDKAARTIKWGSEYVPSKAKE